MRRTASLACLSACIGGVLAALLWTAPARADDWSSFKATHLADDGAVTDDHSGIVHSEGQSYAMLLAVAHGDRRTFDAAWSFAKANLRRDDGLFSWRFENGSVADENNASDAEIVMAWALIEAGRAWDGSYTAEAVDLLAAIRRHLIVERPDPVDPSRTLLLILPGAQGFEPDAAGQLILNPSYWVFPALDLFAEVDDPIYWAEVARSGERLIALASTRGLTPDWLAFPAMAAAEGLSSRSSYDAMRVPLWMAWSGRSSPTFAAWRQLWHDRRTAWIDQSTGEIAPYAPGPEQLAVLALLDRVASAPEGTLFALPVTGARTPYYASAIVQLARLAWKERFAE